ncbi:MAG: hypothetical protein AB1414_06035 [bacterium]
MKPSKPFLILIILLQLLFLLQPAEAVVTIDTSTSSSATALSNQRKIFYDGTNYWAFYFDGGDIAYEYSLDGLSWTNTPVTVAAASSGDDFSLWIDSSTVYLAYEADSYDIKANRGTISGSTINWTTAATAFDGTTTADSYAIPFISKDSNSKLWIAARYYNGIAYYIKVKQSTNPDDISSWGSATNLSNVDNTSAVNYASLIPLGSGQIYAIWIRDTFFEGKLYNGTSWDATTTSIASGPAIPSDHELFSALADSSYNIHLVYIDPSSYLQYKKCLSPYGSTDWSGTTTIDSNTSQDPNIVYNSLKDDLMVFWKRGTDIWYRQKIDDSWDASSTDWISAPAGSYLSSNYSSNVVLSLALVSGTASPYEIAFDKLNTNNSPSVSNLGPTNYINGSENYDRTPTLEFTLSDSDTNDQVKFQIQISLISDFASSVVDYTSELMTPTATSFTVGQTPPSGATYTAGSAGQDLDDGKYWWRIKAIDEWNAQSSWVEANTEGAFHIEADLSFTISGVGLGVTVAGEITTVTTTATSVAFGTLDLNSPEVAAHSLTVTTNARIGYTITIEENENMTKIGSATLISDVAGTNTSPQAWPGSVTYSKFGYHTTDSSLGTGIFDRFSANDTWAALTSQAEEIAFDNDEVDGQETKIVYKIEIGNLQEAGDYGNVITYVCTPVF